MKKLWNSPKVESLEMGLTADDYEHGSDGDGRVWVTNNDGSGGWFLPDIGDLYGPASTGGGS